MSNSNKESFPVSVAEIYSTVRTFNTSTSEIKFSHKSTANTRSSSSDKMHCTLSSNARNPKSGVLSKLQISMTDINTIEAETLQEEQGEIHRCLWPFIRFYRLCGIFPLVKRGNDLIFPKLNFYWIFTVFALMIQCIKFNAIIRSASLNKSGIVVFLMNWTNSLHILGNYIYMIWIIKRIPSFVKSCTRIGQITLKFCEKDDKLPWNCTVLLITYIAATVTRVALFLYGFSVRNNVASIDEFQTVYNKAYGVIGGGQITAFPIVVGYLCLDHCWMLVDLLICVLALIFKQYFVRINNVIAQAGNTSLDNLERLRSIHYKICKLVDECNELFAPLFLLNYTANVSLLFMRLYIGIVDVGTNESGWSKFFNFYSLGIHVLFKLVLPTFLAAGLNEKANEALKFVEKWSSDLWNENESKQRVGIINRFVLQLSTNPIGISGCGYFIVSKNFVITLLSALITYEVIILQFQGLSSNNN